MRRNIGPVVSEKPMEGQLRIRCTMHVCKGVAGYPTRCLPDAGLSSSRTLLETYRGDALSIPVPYFSPMQFA